MIKRISHLIVPMAIMALMACSSGHTPEELVARKAKLYYEKLVQGDYEMFVDGKYRPDSIPASFRKELIANAKMFIGQQKKEHKGIRSVGIDRAVADTAKHVASVFLTLGYGDKTTAVVVVPMVEHKGIWYLR